MPTVPPPPRRISADSAKEVSVMGWLMDDFGNVLLVQQASGLWSLPGGKVFASESLIAGLKREIFEETGLRISSALLIDFFDRPDKAAIAFLYRVTISSAGKLVVPTTGEITACAYAGQAPRAVTPTARYFWRRHFPLCGAAPAPVEIVSRRA